MSRWADLVTGLVLMLAGGLLLAVLAEPPRVPVSDPLGPYGLPRALAAGLVVLGALLLWRRREPAETVTAPAERTAQPAETVTAPAERTREPAATGAAPATSPPTGLPGWVRGASTMAATAGYVLVLTRLGFVAATVLLGVGLLPLLGARRWWTVAAMPVALTAVLWFVFGLVLDVGLPGWLGRY